MCIWVVCLERLNHGTLIVHSPLRLNDDVIRMPVCKGEPSTAAVQLKRVQDLHKHCLVHWQLEKCCTTLLYALLHQSAKDGERFKTQSLQLH